MTKRFGPRLLIKLYYPQPLTKCNKGPYNRCMDKDKLLEDAMSQIEKQFGAGTLMRLGDAATMEVETVSTGSIAL